MDALLSRPEGVAWSVLVAKAKAYSDKHGLTTSVTVGLCRAHAKFRARKDGVTFVDDGEIGKLVTGAEGTRRAGRGNTPEQERSSWYCSGQV